MKSFIGLLFVSCIIIFSNNSLEAQKKMILLENTCCAGNKWDPFGLYYTDSIKARYPDKIILVRPHWDRRTQEVRPTWGGLLDDSMAIPETEIVKKVTGNYGLNPPRVFLDRLYLDDKWQKAKDLFIYIDSVINIPPELSVSVEWSMDESNRHITIKVYAIILEAIDRPLRFNAYIVEDSVKGSGNGWHQANFLSGNPDYKDNPYHDLPDLIDPFTHRHVVRKMCGGAFGVQGSFKQVATEGEMFMHQFDCKLDPSWDMDKLSVVGIVQVFRDGLYSEDGEGNIKEDFRILNSAYGTRNDAAFEVSYSDDDYRICSLGTSFEKTFTLKNTSDDTKEYEINVFKSERTPNDWTVSCDKNSIQTLESKATTDIILRLNQGKEIGIGDAIIEIKEKDNKNSSVWRECISAYSKEITEFSVTDEWTYKETSLDTIFDDISEIKKINDFDAEFYQKHHKEFPNRDLLIWNTGHETGMLDSSESRMLIDEFKNGSNLFIFGSKAPFHHLIYFNNEDKDIFGVEHLAWSRAGWPRFFGVFGKDDDLLCNIIKDTSDFYKILYLVNLATITDTNTTQAILHLSEDSESYYYNEDLRRVDTLLLSENAIFGVKVERGGSRAVLMSRSLTNIKDIEKRNQLLKNILFWLRRNPDSVNDYDISNNIFSLKVSPNPVSDKGKIQYVYDGIIPRKINLSIYDLNGNLVQQIFSGYLNPGEYSSEIDTSPMASGNYRVVLENEISIISVAFIISK